jgi:RHS repeat-associated protein
VVVTDANRSVLERNEYEPYGRVLAPLPVTDGPGFTGHVLDASTGMNYMQQRYYDPGLGLFLSVDPVAAIAKPGTNFNRYWYGSANPYRFVDPDGREDMDLAKWLLGASSDTLGDRRQMQEKNAEAIRSEGRALVNEAKSRVSVEAKIGYAGVTYNYSLLNGGQSVTYGTPLAGVTAAVELKVAVCKGDANPSQNGSNTTIGIAASGGELVMPGVYAEATTTGEYSSGFSLSWGVEGEGSPVTVTQQLPDSGSQQAPAPQAPAAKPAAPKRERSAPTGTRIKQ